MHRVFGHKLVARPNMYEQYLAHHSAVSVKVSLMSSPENNVDPPCLKHLMCRPSAGVEDLAMSTNPIPASILRIVRF